MFYNLMICDELINNNKWELVTDKYGNTFINNEGIHQRIQLSKNVDKKFTTEYTDNKSGSYGITSNIFVSNNNKNMNVNIMNYWTQNSEDMKFHKDDNIAYITVCNKLYKVLEYSIEDNVQIIQTYHKRFEYQGLGILLPNEVNGSVMHIWAKRSDNNTYVQIDIYINNGKISYVETAIADIDHVRHLRYINKKLANKTKFFLISKIGLPTCTFICSSRYRDQLAEKVDGIRNVSIIILEDEAFTDDIKAYKKEAVNKLLEAELTNKRVKAITTVGVKVPNSVCKSYGINYLFSYDIESNTIRCIKSK